MRREVFVSYHHGGDQTHYDDLSSVMHDRLQLFTDNSLERRINSADHAYIMRRIREHHLHGSSCTIVLCGADTWRRKYVDWEIQASLEQQMGLVGVWLPTLPLSNNGGTVKPARLQDNIDSGYAVWRTWRAISADPTVLTDAIELANNASVRLIDNTRARLDRNL
ncbi:TIR domain-containing protein [Bradyrhizobium sp. HKCCYLS20291]|uniref:TIR domain-containing protein n=1 Tax=Bradyrhizobium sp. HKCCYLS20291 TaxID=3420766 RepID=UPI003EC0CE1F